MGEGRREVVVGVTITTITSTIKETRRISGGGLTFYEAKVALVASGSLSTVDATAMGKMGTISYFNLKCKGVFKFHQPPAIQ